MAINVPVNGNNNRGVTLDSSTSTQRTAPRTDFGTQVRNGIAAGAGTAGAAIGVAAPFVPGAAVVSAAVSGAAGNFGGGGGGGGASIGGGAGAGNTVAGIPLGGPGLNTPQGGGSNSAISDPNQQLLDQTKGMQEMMQSFNLQYLQLQEKMQQENRSFSTVSNVMKTKHDTAKSSISNVR